MMGHGREGLTTQPATGSAAEQKVEVTRRQSMDFVLEDTQLGESITSGTLRGALAAGKEMPSIYRGSSYLPPPVANVPKEDIRSFLHHKRVGNYLLGRTLGEGSFAKVKEGFHVLTGEKVAIKVIDKKKARIDPYVSKNMRREARLLQSLRHPNIIRLYEIIETDNSYYLVMELCQGGELMQHIYKQKYLDEKEARKYIRQIVSAVDYLHKSNIIHRDLKVENLLLDGNQNIKIIDFGLSNQFERSGKDGSVEHCTTQCGSPAYAAPELLGQKEYGPEVDIWSVGVNMYAMLTGCLPYTVEPFNITALHAKMLDNKMNDIPDRLSPECKDLMCKMLCPKVESRIKMENIFQHLWFSKDLKHSFTPHPFPNHLSKDSINMEIVSHMVHTIKLEGMSEERVLEALLDKRAVASSAIYYLLDQRLQRYIKVYNPKQVTSRRAKSYCSGDSRDLEMLLEEETRVTKTDQDRMFLRNKKVGKPSSTYLSNRRASAPDPAIIKQFNVDRSRPSTKASTRVKHVSTDPSIYDIPEKGLRPITTVGASRRKSSEDYYAVQQKATAWSSSRHGSFDEGRLAEGKRQQFTNDDDHILKGKESTSARKQSPLFYVGSGDLEDTSLTSNGLPSIKSFQDNSAKKKKDFFSRGGSAKHKPVSFKDGICEIPTRLSIDAIAGEVVRVLSNHHPVDIHSKSDFCYVSKFKKATIQVTINKDLPNLCQLRFNWLSGVSQKAYEDICWDILNDLQV